MESTGEVRVAPYLVVRGAKDAIAFYEKAFGAVESVRLTEPGGRIGHAELSIGKYTLMLADEYPEYGIVGPEDARRSARSGSISTCRTPTPRSTGRSRRAPARSHP